MKKGWIANADLAGGTKDRYSGKVMINRLIGDNQFTVIGSMNNVNDMGFPGGGGGFRRRNQNGLTASKNGGFNFSTTSEKLETGGSVNYRYRDADIIGKQASETFVSATQSSFKNALTRNDNRDVSLTADFRIEWKPDTMSTLIFRPRISYGDTDNASNAASATFNEDPLHTTDEIISAIQQTEGGLADLVGKETVINTVLRTASAGRITLTSGAH